MSLDVTAHKNVKLAPVQDFDELDEMYEAGELEEYPFEAFVIYKGWEDRLQGLEKGKYYTSEDSESFVHYSYGTHTWLRREICKMIGLEEDIWETSENLNGVPFGEWLCFADNEGVIGPIVSKKLLKDFIDWRDNAQQHFKDSDYGMQHYDNWMKTFEFASENGAVNYH